MNFGRMVRAVLFSAFVLAPMLSCAHDLYAAPGWKVKAVIDGDTVELTDGRLIRYIGVDTPEVRKREGRGWKYAPEPYALEAKKLNQSLVLGKTVDIDFDQRHEDRYGRWLGYVSADGRMVNEEILKQGLGILTVFPPNVKHVDLFLAAQGEAKNSRRGIWKEIKTVEHFDAARHVGEIVVVRGRVVDAGRGKSALYLNFEKGRKKDLTVVIWESNLIFFRDEGIFPSAAYHGKIIEVTGKVRDNRGPEIIVYHPSQISVLDE